MELTRYATAEGLLSAAGEFLARREAEHNLPLGILATLRDQPATYPHPPYLAAASDAGRVALVAIRTPPHGLILSESGAGHDEIRVAVERLVADLAAVTPDLPTALGPKSTVEPFAEVWARATGRNAQLELAERIYRLWRVIPPARVPGSWRLAGPRDRTLLVGWLLAFHEEALPAGSVPPDPGIVGRWVGQDDRYAYLWEVDGRVVSLVVAGARTPTGRRIGPVYTPPADRRRGYAGALTAAASQDQLNRGRRFCFLFTDLANPTSNAIYRQVGYEPVADVDQYRFEIAR
jgi:uncharacterized protein